MSAADNNPSNFALFRDCLSTTLLKPYCSASASPEQQQQRRRRHRTAKGPHRQQHHPTASSSPAAPHPHPSPSPEGSTAEELADFTDYLATEIFESLPEELQSLEYRTWRESEFLQTHFSLPLAEENLSSSVTLPPAIPETLVAYKLISSDDDDDSSAQRRRRQQQQSSHLPSSPEAFLVPILTAYLAPLTTPPPATTASRTDACEICGRDWIPLSYHHLIPRFVHEKAVKRGWHRREDLQNVAWLCGACHRFVHGFRNHEELARNYYTVELLLEEDEVRRFAAWVGRLRWKGR